MIIFLNEDRAYLYWVTHHRQGFVLDGCWTPKVGHLLLHRATCSEIKTAGSRVHWTTGSKLKACGLERAEVEAWGLAQTGKPVAACETCHPEIEAAPVDGGELHLTKLAADVLDYVLDAALIHLEHESPPYHLTVSDIAACFGKQPGQLGPVLRRLAADGLVALAGGNASAAAIPPKRIVLPTARALRTLEAFREESEAAVEAELQKLHLE